MTVKPETAGYRSLLGVDLSGSADDPLASRARTSLASRIVSLLIGLITTGIGGVLIAARVDYLLGGALLATGLARFPALYLVKSHPGAVFAVNNISGALIIAFGLVEIGTAAGLDAWGMLVVGIPLLLMGPQQGRLRSGVYAASIAILALGEIVARLLPPRIELSAVALSFARIVNLIGAATVLATLTWVYRKALDRTEARVAEQQKVSDRLLANILPEPIAERLKRDEYPIADTHEAATIMFADGVNFSTFAARRSPQAVVALLNKIFYAFDDLVERRGVEKIKTMGDAYMAAGGLTGEAAAGTAAVADLAFEMLDFVHELGRAEGVQINLRIGIHTGPLVAGVIGRRKFSYDIWGETVNTAAHLEKASQPGRIHISEATMTALGPGWLLEQREPVTLKGLGTISTYFLLGRAAPLAIAAK